MNSPGCKNIQNLLGSRDEKETSVVIGCGLSTPAILYIVKEGTQGRDHILGIQEDSWMGQQLADPASVPKGIALFTPASTSATVSCRCLGPTGLL